MHYENNREGKNIANLSRTQSEYEYVSGRIHM